MSRLALFLFGAPRVEKDGIPIHFDRRKAVALLVYLAVTRRAHQREALATFFWPELDQARAHAALRRTLVAIKKGTGDGWLEADRESVGLSNDAFLWVDVTRFRDCLVAVQAHRHPQDRLCSFCVAALAEAVALYHCDAMAGFTLRDSPDFDEWQRELGEALRGELAGVLEKLEREYAARGDLEAALGSARRRLALDPLCEQAHRRLMQLYALCGQRTAALEQYQACRDILERELGLSPSPETIRLYDDIHQNELLSFTPGQAMPPSNLPQQSTPFVGRTAELVAIARHLANPACRLLTLVGPGGIGKTRLALEAAAGQRSCFPHGVYWVPFAAVQTHELVIPTLAAAIGFTLAAQEREPDNPFLDLEHTPKAQLLDHLWNKELLLVLDNWEHLIDGSGLLAEMLAAAPGLKLLVTSRERLNLGAEWLFEIEGMHVPAEAGTSDEVESHESVQLFLSAARRIAPRFSAEACDLVRICRRLDGIPLALELAAAWAHTLSGHEIANRVERAVAGAGLGFFAAHQRDAPARHRSMRAVFEHSWNLLSEEEQATLAALAVFQGSFDRQAADRVARTSLAVLSALVDKSLVRRTRPGGTDSRTRYELHELLRQYAQEKLGEDRSLRDRHASYYMAFLGQRESLLWGPDESRVLAEIEQEIGNVRAAWEWAVVSRQEREIGQALESLFRFCTVRSRFREGWTALQQAVAAWEDSSPSHALLLGRLLVRSGQLAHYLEEIQAARELLERGLAVLRSLDAPVEVAYALLWLGNVASREEQRSQARLWTEEGLAIGRETGNLPLIAEGLRCLADWMRSQKMLAQAQELYRQSLAISRELGDRSGLGAALYGLARAADWSERQDEVEILLRESLAIRQELGDRRGEAWCHHFLAELRRGQGRYAEARQLYERSLAIQRALGDPLCIWNVLQRMGDMVCRLGDYEALEEIAQEVHALAQRYGSRFGYACSLEGLGTVAHLKGDYVRARQYYQESLRIGYEIEHPRAIGWSLMGLGDADYETGQLDSARTRYEQSLAVSEEHEVEDGISLSLPRLGRVANALGDHAASRAYFARVLRFAMDRGRAVLRVNVLGEIGPLLANSGRIEDALMLAFFVLQRPELWQPEKGQLQRLATEWAAALSPEAAAAARQRASEYALEQVCAWIQAFLSASG